MPGPPAECHVRLSWSWHANWWHRKSAPHPRWHCPDRPDNSAPRRTRERITRAGCMVYHVWCAPLSYPVCCVYRVTPPGKQSIDRDSVSRPKLCLNTSNCRSRSAFWNDTPSVCVAHSATLRQARSSRTVAPPERNYRSLCDRSCPASNQSSPDYTDYNHCLWQQPVN